MTKECEFVIKTVDGKLILDKNDAIIELYDGTIMKMKQYKEIMKSIKQRLDFMMPTKGD